MNIKYNIASHRKINYTLFILLAAALVILSAALVTGGALQLAATSKQFKTEKEELRAYKEKIQAINEREAQQEQEIKKVKAKHRRKRSFLNMMIDDKLFPYMNKLDQLEEVLPAGVFVRTISLSTKNKASVQVGIAAVSSQKLLEAYKVFLKYNLVVNNETEADGLFRATITIVLKHETK
jgi:cell division protein FtsB